MPKFNKRKNNRWMNSTLDDLYGPDDTGSTSDNTSDDSWDEILEDIDDDNKDFIEIVDNRTGSEVTSVKPALTAIERMTARSGRPISRSQPASPQSSAEPMISPIRAVVPVGGLGPDDPPEPDGGEFANLWDCGTLLQSLDWHADTHATFGSKAIKAIERMTLPNPIREGIHALVAGQATNAPIMLSEKVCRIAAGHIHRGLVPLIIDDPEFEFAFVTIIDGDATTSTDVPVIDLVGSQAKFLPVIRAMSKNFLGMTELAFFNSHRHPLGGRVLHRHEHFLVWGPNVFAKAKAVASRRMSVFAPNFTGATQIKVQRVEASEANLARMAAYLFKAPSKAMTWKPEHQGKPGYLHHSEKGDRAINYLRMAQLRSMLLIDDVLHAGGQGKAIRSDLIKLLRATCKSEVPVQSRRFQFDEIASFWVQVAQELERTMWQLPVIIRRR
jgi:hypothetical protein